MQQGKLFKAPCQWVSPLSDSAFDVRIVNESPSWLWNAKSAQRWVLILSCEYCSAYVTLHLEFSCQTWLLFPAAWGSSYLSESSTGDEPFPFIALHQQNWLLTLFWDKRKDVVFSYLLKSRQNILQYLWLSVTKKLSVVCVCVSVSRILMSHVNPTFVTNFTVIDHLHRVWIITSPNRIPNIMTTLPAPSNWFTCVTMAASCCIVLQRLSD